MTEQLPTPTHDLREAFEEQILPFAEEDEEYIIVEMTAEWLADELLVPPARGSDVGYDRAGPFVFVLFVDRETDDGFHIVRGHRAMYVFDEPRSNGVWKRTYNPVNATVDGQWTFPLLQSLSDTWQAKSNFEFFD